MDTKRYHILYALLVRVMDDAASISTTINVGRKVGRMSEGTISVFPSGAPMDHPGHFRVRFHMSLSVRDFSAGMIYLSFVPGYRNINCDLLHHEIGICIDCTKA